MGHLPTHFELIEKACKSMGKLYTHARGGVGWIFISLILQGPGLSFLSSFIGKRGRNRKRWTQNLSLLSPTFSIFPSSEYHVPLWSVQSGGSDIGCWWIAIRAAQKQKRSVEPRIRQKRIDSCRSRPPFTSSSFFFSEGGYIGRVDQMAFISAQHLPPSSGLTCLHLM